MLEQPIEMTSSPPRAVDRVPVSVVIPVLNEERNIAPCIESVRWADEIFVVDSGSRDKTTALADDLGRRWSIFAISPEAPERRIGR